MHYILLFLLIRLIKQHSAIQNDSIAYRYSNVNPFEGIPTKHDINRCRVSTGDKKSLSPAHHLDDGKERKRGKESHLNIKTTKEINRRFNVEDMSKRIKMRKSRKLSKRFNRTNVVNHYSKKVNDSINGKLLRRSQNLSAKKGPTTFTKNSNHTNSKRNQYGRRKSQGAIVSRFIAFTSNNTAAEHSKAKTNKCTGILCDPATFTRNSNHTNSKRKQYQRKKNQGAIVSRFVAFTSNNTAEEHSTAKTNKCTGILCGTLDKLKLLVANRSDIASEKSKLLSELDGLEKQLVHNASLAQTAMPRSLPMDHKPTLIEQDRSVYTLLSKIVDQILKGNLAFKVEQPITVEANPGAEKATMNDINHNNGRIGDAMIGERKTMVEPQIAKKQRKAKVKLGKLHKRLYHSENDVNQKDIILHNLKQCEMKNQAIDEHFASLTQTVAQQQSLLTEEKGVLKEQEREVSALMGEKDQQLVSKLAFQKEILFHLESRANTLFAKVGAVKRSMNALNEEHAQIRGVFKKTVVEKTSVEQNSVSVQVPNFVSANESGELMNKVDKLLNHSENVDQQKELLLQKLKQCEMKHQEIEEHVASLAQIATQQKGVLTEEDGVLKEQERANSLMSGKVEELIGKLAFQNETLFQLERRANKLAAKVGAEKTWMNSRKEENAQNTDTSNGTIAEVAES